MRLLVRARALEDSVLATRFARYDVESGEREPGTASSRRR